MQKLVGNARACVDTVHGCLTHRQLQPSLRAHKQFDALLRIAEQLGLFGKLLARSRKGKFEPLEVSRALGFGRKLLPLPSLLTTVDGTGTHAMNSVGPIV